MTNAVAVTIAPDVYYDPWDLGLNADPYPMFTRLRAEAPLYYNEVHDFYAVSRFADVNQALIDHQTFSSARGVVLEIDAAIFSSSSAVRGWDTMPALPRTG